MRSVFTSRVSFEDAAGRAQQAGFRVTGYAQNKKGEFVVFATRDERGAQGTTSSKFGSTQGRTTSSDIRSKIW